MEGMNDFQLATASQLVVVPLPKLELAFYRIEVLYVCTEIRCTNTFFRLNILT